MTTTRTTAEQQIRTAYATLSNHRPTTYTELEAAGLDVEWYPLSKLEGLVDMTADQWQTTLRAMAALPDVQLAAEADQKRLKPIDRQTAVLIGGVAHHRIVIVS